MVVGLGSDPSTGQGGAWIEISLGARPVSARPAVSWRIQRGHSGKMLASKLPFIAHHFLLHV